MDPNTQLAFDLTDLGRKIVSLLRQSAYLKPRLSIVDKPGLQSPVEEPLQQAAGTRQVKVRVASELTEASPEKASPEVAPEEAAPEELWDASLMPDFYDEEGNRTSEGITRASYLLALADFQERTGQSPTLDEWGREYAKYRGAGTPVSGQMVTEKAKELISLGFVRKMYQKKRSAVVSEEGRDWMWKLSKYADIPSVMSHLLASGKISADDIKESMGDPDPSAKEKVMSALGLDPLGRKPGTPIHLPLRD